MIRFSHLLLASALSLSALAASAAAGHAPAIVAHRGGTADAPENTRIAIETALKTAPTPSGSPCKNPKTASSCCIALRI